jgi:hypothetical protein
VRVHDSLGSWTCYPESCVGIVSRYGESGGNKTTDGVSGLTGIADILCRHQNELYMGPPVKCLLPTNKSDCTTLWECKNYDLLVKRHGTLVKIRRRLLNTV